MGRSREAQRTNDELERQRQAQEARDRERDAEYDDWLYENQRQTRESRYRANRAYEDASDQIRGTRGYWEGIGRTGGYSPEDRARLEGDIESLRRYSQGGSVTPEDRARIRGGGVYDEFSKTGGWSEDDKQNYRARAGSVIPSFFKNLKQTLETQNRAQGGYNPGYTSQTAKLARDSSRQANEANIEAENYIGESVRGGRRWGAEGMSQSEMALQDLLDRIYQGGMGKALAGASDLYGNIARNRVAAGQGLSETDRAILAAASGFGDLYSTDAGLESNYLRARQGQQQHEDSQAGQWWDRQNQRYPNIGFWDRALPILQSAAGSAAGAFSSGFRRRDTEYPFVQESSEILPRRNRYPIYL